MKLLDNLEGLVTSKIEAVKGIFTLFKLETKLAGLNIIPLLVNCGIIIATALTIWLTSMGLIGYLTVLFLGGHTWAGFLVILLLNIGLMGMLLKRIKINLQLMSFQKTRASLTDNHLRGTYELSAHPARADKSDLS